MRRFLVVVSCWLILCGSACSDSGPAGGDAGPDGSLPADGGADDTLPPVDGDVLDASRDSSPGDSAFDSGGPDGGEADGSTATDADEPDGPEAEPGVRGLVEIVQRHMGEGAVGFSVTASFVDGESEVSCSEESDGFCTAASCTYPTAPTPGIATLVSAGTLTVSGGLTEVTVTPRAMGYEALGTVALWDGGQTLTVSAAGNIAPGFSVELQPSQWPELTAPVLPSGGSTFSVDRSEELLVAWDVPESTLGGLVWAELMRTEESAGEVQEWRVRCRWPASAGTGTISSAMLSTIPAGERGVVGFSSGDEAALTVEGWSIRTIASEMLAAEGRPFASAGATFE